MTRLLSLFGLMRVSEHEAVEQDRDDWRDKSMEQSVEIFELHAKFKQAVADLERVVIRNQELMFEKGQLAAANSSLRSEINDLRPDALAMRRKRQRDRDLKAAKAAGKVQP